LKIKHEGEMMQSLSRSTLWTRRELMRGLAALGVTAASAPGTLGFARSGEQTGSDVDLLKCVNVMIGTGGHGHMYPGATVPFGMVQLSLQQ
jgi:putative alpha-1,2-mannosidase